jgi:predicted enzyme related to lactoylglutathione lyase
MSDEAPPPRQAGGASSSWSRFMQDFPAIGHPGGSAAGRFCWLDLAATDAGRAETFYGQLFGWTSHEQSANGGSFTRLRLDKWDVGSLYQLNRRQREAGMPSHWTPYVCVNDADETVRRAIACGGQALVRPFTLSEIARIALIQDSVGAPVGLWQPFATEGKEDAGR